MSRGRIVVAAIVLALILAGYGAWWLHAAARLRDGVGQWAEARRADGYVLALEDVTVQGFPLKLQVVAREFSIGREAPVAWRWSGPRLAASAPPWVGRRVSVTAPGAHKVEYDTPAGRRAIPFTAEKADATVRVGDDLRIARVDVDLGTIVAAVPDVGDVKAEQLLLALTAAPKSAPPPPATSPRAPEVGRLAFITIGVELPPGAAPPSLGPRIARTDAEILLLGAIPTASTRTAMAEWRDAGGTLEIDKLRMHWGEFQAETQGSVALDRDLQPVGALTVRMWGVGALIDALVAGGQMRAREGATARVVLRSLAKPSIPTQNIPPEIEVSLTVQDRRLYLGPIPLMPIPPIAWP
jgi:hypothetical protein